VVTVADCGAPKGCRVSEGHPGQLEERPKHDKLGQPAIGTPQGGPAAPEMQLPVVRPSDTDNPVSLIHAGMGSMVSARSVHTIPVSLAASRTGQDVMPRG
jgi:hypothetical protein